MPFDVMPHRGDQLLQDGWVDRGGAGDHLGWCTFSVAKARWKNRRAKAASRRTETSTSMTCPSRSMARYTYRQTPLTLTEV
jgi:hypothetical protein